MNAFSRRTFVKRAALAVGAGALTRVVPSSWARPIGANDAVRIAVIGLGGMGSYHARRIPTLPDARLAGICDVDPQALAREVEYFQGAKIAVPAVTDPRRVLERDDVDAVMIATPNHWHALLTVWACQAGKDVYVEKPVAHAPWQGAQMVAAAEKYGRVVQAGTQSRSDPTVPALRQFIAEGHAGKVQWIHALTYKPRPLVAVRPEWVPDWLDYDLWCGPAPRRPLDRERLHYDWHFFWDTGNGDLGNLGVHQVDLACWLTGQEEMPARVMSFGGRFGPADAAQTPNVQVTLLDYAGVPILFENRGLPAKPDVSYSDHFHGTRTGFVVQCEAGYFAGYQGGAFYDHAGRKVRQFEGDGGGDHLPNFIRAVRNRAQERLAAPIQIGHRSTAKCLYGNVSYQLGAPSPLRELRAALETHPFAVEALDRVGEHVAAHGAKLNESSLVLGPWVTPTRDGAGVSAVEGGNAETLARARRLARPEERAGFAIPDAV
ncbi:MAG TPA: Gfo/Idh/MocA family oxidoreductase [Opitutus sp.]|nr:Gfo/Idh/MocA family oxidoreductase [Opitutus sp.]